MKATIVVMIVVLMSATAGAATAQPGETKPITVEEAVHLTLQNQPVILQAEYGETAARANIDISRSSRLPDVSLNGSYDRIGPVSSFDLPGVGPLEVAPRNNYDLHIKLNQTIYDFGKTDAAIARAETSRQDAADNLSLVKFNLAYRTIGVFNSILILHRQIAVLDEQFNALQQHLAISIKKMRAGTATDFDTLTIRSKMAIVQSDRIDAMHALDTREIAFRRLTGLGAESPVNLQGDFTTDSVSIAVDSLLALAERRRPELVLARDDERRAAADVRSASVGTMPRLSLNLMAGLRNGYEPDLNTWRGNYTAGVEMDVPVFDGNRTKHKTTEARAMLGSAREHTRDIKRKITADVRHAVAGVRSSMDKIASTDIQVRQAEEAVSVARVRYEAGVATNLDLLDAENTLSEAKLIRLRAIYDYTVSLRELDRATGLVPQ